VPPAPTASSSPSTPNADGGVTHPDAGLAPADAGVSLPGWTLVWQDEFDGPEIDPSKWVFETKKPGWVNHELEAYTGNRPENARIEDGHLIIEARHDNFEGNEYTSGRIRTEGKASWQTGRFEAKIQLPGGLGSWPAFWLMPDDQTNGWPACGEIDIMEEVGFDPDTIHATTHSTAYNWKSATQRTATTTASGATLRDHVYAMEWFDDRIDVFVDGAKYFTSKNDGTGEDAWPFDKKFHIILNVAIGGDWGGAQGVDPNVWPRQMRVDYVRVYRK
jgi:beta-glucanase (GH16 family)